MTRDKIYNINKERFTRWLRRLTDSHATPMVTLGVGHDHVSGQIVIITTEDGPSESEILLLMREACRQLEHKIATQN